MSEVTEYVQNLDRLVKKAWDFLPEASRPYAMLTLGRKYYKVVVVRPDSVITQRTVHAFIDAETLDVYKPAGWAAPAKGVRYNLTQDLPKLLENMDPYGSYLYK